ncbi:hypothetical protein M885DRAFT_526821 [Pelagophyceae sp. CCMP2097]|nr:hypothetical protein M885DRAFT_526821 [Pelagophyceae sp. CCMP2097]
MSRSDAERRLRLSCKSVVDSVTALEKIKALDGESEDAIYADQVTPTLALLAAALDALDLCGTFDDPAARAAALQKRLPPPPPADMLSLGEMKAIFVSLEAVAAWGVAPLVNEGLRPLGDNRKTSRAAKLPRRQNWQPRPWRRQGASPQRDELRRCWDVLQRVALAEPLAPVAARFVADSLAAAVQLDHCAALDAAAGAAAGAAAASLADQTLAAAPGLGLVVRALRELLGGVAVTSVEGALEGRAVVAPKWCSSRCTRLLATVARSNLDAVLAEFAGPDELSARTAFEAGNILERRVATALAALPETDQDGYVKDIAPQLVAVVRREARLAPDEGQQAGEPDDASGTNEAHARISRTTLGILAEYGRFDVVLREAICGGLAGHSDAQTSSEALRGLVCDVVAVLCCAPPPPPLAAMLCADVGLWGKLVRLHAFACNSGRNHDADAALKCLGGLATAHAPSFEAAADCVLAAIAAGGPTFHSAADGGIEMRRAAADDATTETLFEGLGLTSPKGAVDAEGVLDLLRQLKLAELVGAVFARCLEAYLREKRKDARTAEATENAISARALADMCRTLEVGALIAGGLDDGSLEASGVGLIDALRVVLEDVSASLDAIGGESAAASEGAEEGADDALEQLALSSVLAIVEFGSKTRSDEEEAALWALLPFLKSLARPHRASRDLAALAADCGARLVARKCDLTKRSRDPAQKPDSVDAILADACVSLASKEPPERAFAIVQLANLAKKARNANDALRLAGRTSQPEAPQILEWRKLAAIIVVALEDSESYVFLAAVHALALCADASPLDVIPWLCDAHETSKLKVFDDDDAVHLSESARARLGEALVTAMKRRDAAAIARYAPQLARSFIRGARPGAQPEMHRAACLSCLAELAAVAKDGIASFGLDVVELVAGILERPGESLACRRAAAYLAHRALGGPAALALVEAAPRDTAKMCRAVERLLQTESDSATQHYAAAALDDVARLVDAQLRPKTDGDRLRLPLEKDNWLAAPDRSAAAGPDRFAGISEIISRKT